MADRSGLYESSRSTNTSPRYSSQVSPARTSNYSGAFSETRGSTAPSYTAPAPQPQNASYVRGANEIRGTDIIAEYLIKEKVPYILGYAGHGAIGLLDGIHKHTDRIRHIQPRIEQAAGFMADVYYRLTGDPLAVYASTGPGPMNMMIAVANAFYDGSAFFLITGNVPTTQFDSGALQDDYRYHGDMSSMFTPIVKKSWRVRKVEDLVKALPDAFTMMRTGRPGPVHFDMPFDLYMRTAPVSTPDPAVHGQPLNWRTTVADETVEKALHMLVGAQRPLILAGGGVRVGRAYDELKAFAEQIDVPVYTSFMGKSALPFDHRLNLGVAGVWGEYPATEAARSADVILAVGARFNDLHTGSWLPGYVYNIPPTRLIQVDIDPEEIGRNYPVEIGMVGDAKAFLAQAHRIARAKNLRFGYGSPWHKEIEAWRTDWRNFCEPFERSSEVPIEPRRMMAEMNKISPPDTVMVDDVGNCQVWSEQYWRPRTPGSHLTAGGFAAMGFGVAGVMGARLARPDSPCVTLCGDGGFMMMPHVIATAVEHNLPAVWVLQNNYAIGTIRDLQRFYHDGREIGTSFVNQRTGQLWNPDFAKMTEAMGGRGIRIEHPDQFGDAYREALRSDIPTVLDVIINRDTAMPVVGTWQMPPIPEVQPTFGKRKIR
ncbi:MAG: thiamine pyrophosphate-binding protein [Hyphomicrobiales bacterium]|nr:thiamine pyrophosphate-binding protein [Hyphomicrobiales bacterium]